MAVRGMGVLGGTLWSFSLDVSTDLLVALCGLKAPKHLSILGVCC